MVLVCHGHHNREKRISKVNLLKGFKFQDSSPFFLSKFVCEVIKINQNISTASPQAFPLHQHDTKDRQCWL